MSDTVTLLRSETKQLHEKLDQLTVFQPVFSSNATHKDYLKYLTVLYPIYKNFEKEVYSSAKEFIPSIAENQRLNSLLADYGKVPPNEVDVRFFTIHSKYEVLGMLYVLEGSRMGGKMMAKNLKENANLNDSQLDFLLQEMSVSWTTIMKELNSVTDEKEQALVLDGAKEMFNCFYNHCVQF